MYLIKHKARGQYLQKWFVRDNFGHWEDKPRLFNKTTRDKVLNALGDSVEIIYKRGAKKCK